MQPSQTSSSVLYCENHPQTETGLRCNRCNKPICAKCAVLTPTGYRCTDCVREQKKRFDTALWYDYLLAFGVAAVLGWIGAVIAARLGFFTLFVAPIAGGIIAEAVRRVVGKRRSKALFQIAAAGVVLGSLGPVLPYLAFFFMGGGLEFSYALLWPAVYTFMATSTAYYRLSGINFGR